MGSAEAEPQTRAGTTLTGEAALRRRERIGPGVSRDFQIVITCEVIEAIQTISCGGSRGFGAQKLPYRVPF